MAGRVSKQDLAQFGTSMQSLLAGLGQIFQQQRYQREVGQAMDQSRFGVSGGQPVQMTRDASGRPIPAQPLSPIDTSQIPIDQAKFIQALLPLMARGNPNAKTAFWTTLATQPKYQFINQEGGGLQQATIPLVGEPTVKQISPSQFKPTAASTAVRWRTKRDEKGGIATEKVGNNFRVVEEGLDASGKPIVGTDGKPLTRLSTGGSEGGGDISKILQLERLRDQYNAIEKDLNDLNLGFLRGSPVKNIIPEGTDVNRWIATQIEGLRTQLKNKADSINKLEGTQPEATAPPKKGEKSVSLSAYRKQYKGLADYTDQELTDHLKGLGYTVTK